MAYIDQTLIFESDKIYFYDDAFGENFEVMMDWEDTIMSASAAYVCEGGGDILEIGFGMGISAGYMQSHSIKSHTIIENHPDIIPKAQAWASGLFYDTFGDDDLIYFSASLSPLVKAGGVVTWWNNCPMPDNFYNIPNVTYNQYSISPPSNNYFNNNTYYLPKKEF